MTVRTKLINRRYRLERRISLNGASETWLGFDNVLHRAVAVSVPRQELLRNGPLLVQFLQRSRIATALHQRGIVAAFDSGEDGDTPYLVSEYLGGESLFDIIRAESPFDVDDVAILVEQVAGALDYAHQRGFVHGSLAPDDVIVDGQGAAKLVGLGLPIGTTSVAGTGAPLTIDDDILALAAIAFEMLTGEETGAVESDSSGEAYLINPDVPRNASDIVAIGLGAGTAKFTTAGAFSRSLSAWKTFDPGEFFVAPEPVDVTPGDSGVLPMSRPPLDSEPSSGFELADESPDDVRVAASAAVARRRNAWATLGALILALIASAIVWYGNQTVTVPTAQVASELAELARLSGF